MTSVADTGYSSFELPVTHIEDTAPMTEAEQAIRRDLAAAYRLCAVFGWDDLIYTHISARLPGPEHHFLVNPLGLGFDEITASSLVKIDLDGNVIGDTPYRPNAAGFVIHGAIHSAREDAQCVMHLHSEAGMALSTLEAGLLPITQHAMRFHGRLGYHDYEGIALSTAERERLVADLGGHVALILRNHGTITTGRSVAQAFTENYYLEKAARAQLLAMAAGSPLITPPREVIELTVRQWVGDLGVSHDREWPSLVRKLDRADPSYRD
ncbi:class II aldolase [Amycolatopsis sp. NBRC 101858]|uniref:class II aldolase/adducin family protein n=1 Tax=Amycolatopsis sp. NBRC 101858 TaxID=3032200 RepID=UPI0024A43C71|nr:class II aldolase/adducin family protein [Amycolatopsis sp. NBRC 101858]GLY38909.1 class II aldolase [Amycolatopsis sp. NBRC 101858]